DELERVGTVRDRDEFDVEVTPLAEDLTEVVLREEPTRTAVRVHDMVGPEFTNDNTSAFLHGAMFDGVDVQKKEPGGPQDAAEFTQDGSRRVIREVVEGNVRHHRIERMVLERQ